MTECPPRYFVAFFFIAGAISVVPAVEGQSKTPSLDTAKRSKLTVTQIQQLVSQLSHPRFRVREAAAQKLKNGGFAAAQALVRATSDELEVKLRVVALLRHLLKDHQPFDTGIPLKTLVALASEESPVVHGWALKALKNRSNAGSDEAEHLLRQMCKSTNQQIAQMAVDLLYPLPADRQTKRLVGGIAQIKSRVDSYRKKIAQIKKRKDLGELSKRIDIESYQEAIKQYEVELRFFQAELLKRRMAVQEKR